MSTGPVSTVERLLRGFWAAPLVGGALLCASFPPLDLGFLAPVGVAILLLSMRLRRGERAGRQGWLAGLVVFFPGIFWISKTVGGGWVFTAIWSAGFMGLHGWLLSRLWLRRGGASWVLGAVLLQLLVDMLRSVALTGFPWLLIGYSGWENPVLLGSADLFGVHGATVAIVLLGAGLAEIVARRLDGGDRTLRPLLPAVIAWAVLAGWALAKPDIETTPGPRVALLQADIPQELKEQVAGAQTLTPEQQRALDREFVREWLRKHDDLIVEAWAEAQAAGETIDVVVWPETMVPAELYRPLDDPGDAKRRASNDRVLRILTRMSSGAQTLAGIRVKDRLDRVFNSVVKLDADGTPRGIQDKEHLAPGGEYVPYLDIMPFGDQIEAALKANAGLPDAMTAGDGGLLLSVTHGETESAVGVLICWESVFPEIPRQRTNDGADFLLLAANYGWFEQTAFMQQALGIARFRAVENGRSFVLASNNGPSVVIGPDGQIGPTITDQVGRTTDISGVLVATVPLAQGGTPFLLWGETPAWVLGFLGLVWGVLRRRRERAGHDSGVDAP